MGAIDRNACSTDPALKINSFHRVSDDDPTMPSNMIDVRKRKIAEGRGWLSLGHVSPDRESAPRMDAIWSSSGARESDLAVSGSEGIRSNAD